MYNHNNLNNDPARIRYPNPSAPNDPIEEEGEEIYEQPLPQEPTRQMDYSHIKYVVYILSTILALSYIPGFLSITNQM